MKEEKYSLVNFEHYNDCNSFSPQNHYSSFTYMKKYLKLNGYCDKNLHMSEMVILNLYESEERNWYFMDDFMIKKSDEPILSFKNFSLFVDTTVIPIFIIERFNLKTLFLTQIKYLPELSKIDIIHGMEWKFIFDSVFNKYSPDNEKYVIHLAESGKISWEMASPMLSEKYKKNNMTIISLDKMGF